LIIIPSVPIWTWIAPSLIWIRSGGTQIGRIWTWIGATGLRIEPGRIPIKTVCVWFRPILIQITPSQIPILPISTRVDVILMQIDLILPRHEVISGWIAALPQHTVVSARLGMTSCGYAAAHGGKLASWDDELRLCRSTAYCLPLTAYCFPGGFVSGVAFSLAFFLRSFSFWSATRSLIST
jgi:hypothetical protein